MALRMIRKALGAAGRGLRAAARGAAKGGEWVGDVARYQSSQFSKVMGEHRLYGGMRREGRRIVKAHERALNRGSFLRGVASSVPGRIIGGGLKFIAGGKAGKARRVGAGLLTRAADATATAGFAAATAPFALPFAAAMGPLKLGLGMGKEAALGVGRGAEALGRSWLDAGAGAMGRRMGNVAMVAGMAGIGYAGSRQVSGIVKSRSERDRANTMGLTGSLHRAYR